MPLCFKIEIVYTSCNQNCTVYIVQQIDRGTCSNVGWGEQGYIVIFWAPACLTSFNTEYLYNICMSVHTTEFPQFSLLRILFLFATFKLEVIIKGLKRSWVLINFNAKMFTCSNLQNTCSNIHFYILCINEFWKGKQLTIICLKFRHKVTISNFTFFINVN